MFAFLRNGVETPAKLTGLYIICPYIPRRHRHRSLLATEIRHAIRNRGANDHHIATHERRTGIIHQTIKPLTFHIAMKANLQVNRTVLSEGADRGPGLGVNRKQTGISRRHKQSFVGTAFPVGETTCGKAVARRTPPLITFRVKPPKGMAALSIDRHGKAQGRPDIQDPVDHQRRRFESVQRCFQLRT